jgi:hypothetical protein
VWWQSEGKLSMYHNSRSERIGNGREANDTFLGFGCFLYSAKQGMVLFYCIHNMTQSNVLCDKISLMFFPVSGL